ncbi:MAG TPA: MFS transporter [Blastocatellia bacterium]|nr:MFS transporter [Blastocatellia bacterium]
MRTTKTHRAREAVRALRHRNYRVYYFGMLVSFTGTWMQSVAQSWLVYRMTGSPWLLGLVGFASQAPVFLLAPLGGVLADRHSRLRIIILTQTLAMVQALILAALTLSNRVTVASIVVLALTLGAINSFDLPARQSFMIELVGREDLMNAISLNSSMIQGSRVAGPAVAGLLVGWLGEGPCFLINGLSYVAVIAGLLTIRVGGDGQRQAEGSALANLRDGFNYVRRTRTVRALLLLVAFVSIFGLPYTVLMPIFASDVLGGGPRALGLLLCATGVGALAGALTLAARKSVQGLGRVVAFSAASFGFLLMLFSLSHDLALSAVLLFPIGFCVLVQMSASNTLVQMIVPDQMRGRLMSFYAMSLMGMAPFGSLLAGAITVRAGAPRTVAFGGALCLIAAIVFWFRLPSLRHEALPHLIAHRTLPIEPSEADPGRSA